MAVLSNNHLHLTKSLFVRGQTPMENSEWKWNSLSHYIRYSSSRNICQCSVLLFSKFLDGFKLEIPNIKVFDNSAAWFQLIVQQPLRLELCFVFFSKLDLLYSFIASSFKSANPALLNHFMSLVSFYTFYSWDLLRVLQDLSLESSKVIIL